MTPEQIAAAYQASKRGIQAEYVGGGRIRIKNTNTPSLCCRYMTIPQARAALAQRNESRG
ncbi:hypothetical protein FX016_22950 [Cupriavidus gilardii]|nr:hypothetical protein FX016_22950 [Cupriavidus gilardii]